MIATCTKWIENKFSDYNLLINLYGIYYKNIVSQEIKLAKIKEDDRVLCIGGGSIPSTAIEIVNQTNACVDVIDIDSKAVKQAKNVVSKLGLENKINVINQNGQDMDIKNYDVVHIALQVSPKEKIVEYIWDNLTNGKRIAIRTPKRLLKSFYSSLPNHFTKNNYDSIKDWSFRNRFNTMEKTLVMVKS